MSRQISAGRILAIGAISNGLTPFLLTARREKKFSRKVIFLRTSLAEARKGRCKWKRQRAIETGRGARLPMDSNQYQP